MAVTNGYTTRDQVKAALDITTSVDDSLIDDAINAVSRWIDEYCQRRFWKDSVDTTRTYVPDGWYELPIDDLVSVTSLKTDSSGDGVFETTWTNADYQLLPHNPAAYPETRPYRCVRAVGSKIFPPIVIGARFDLVQIVGIFGWPAVPEAVRQACQIQAVRVFKRKNSPEGILSGFGDMSALRVGSRLDPDVEQLLAGYRRMPVGIA